MTEPHRLATWNHNRETQYYDDLIVERSVVIDDPMGAGWIVIVATIHEGTRAIKIGRVPMLTNDTIQTVADEGKTVPAKDFKWLLHEDET